MSDDLATIQEHEIGTKTPAFECPPCDGVGGHTTRLSRISYTTCCEVCGGTGKLSRAALAQYMLTEPDHKPLVYVGIDCARAFGGKAGL